MEAKKEKVIKEIIDLWNTGDKRLRQHAINKTKMAVFILGEETSRALLDKMGVESPIRYKKQLNIYDLQRHFGGKIMG